MPSQCNEKKIHSYGTPMLLKFDLVHSQHFISLLIAFYWRHFGILCLFCNSKGICVSRERFSFFRPYVHTTHASISSIRRGFVPGFVNYYKGGTRLSAASDKVDQLLAHGRWFFPGIPASSITKTGRHEIAEILLKVALIKKINQAIKFPCLFQV